MALVSLKCPSCGADIELDESREFGFCTYCGTKIIQEKQIVELKGKVEIEGVSTSAQILERAYILVEDRKYSEAEVYFDKVLELNPKCSEGYWGKMLCEYRVSDAEEAESKGFDITKSNNYNRAVMYADERQKEEYTEYGKKAATAYAVNEKNAVKAQRKKLLIFELSKLFFAILPVAAFIIHMTGTSETSGGGRRFFIFIVAAIWVISYFARKKLNRELNPQSANKKSNASIWCVIGGFFVVCSLLMPFGTTADQTAANTTTTTMVETTEAPIEITAAQLIKAYEDNEINANNKFKGKILHLTGYVDDISQSDGLFSESFYVYLDNGEKNSYDYVMCSLSESGAEKAAKLKKGDKITIEGECDGISVTSVYLSNCDIVD